MADHLELVAEIPKVEKLTVQDRLELAKKRRSQQLKRWDREKDEEFGPPPPKKRPQRAKPVKFEPRIILLEAASRGDYDEVKKMLDYGVDPNLANDDGLTSLHQACIDECEDIAELLVGYGADIDAEDRELWTPLHASAACENFAMVQYLIENGANVAAINSDGNLPVDLVEEDEELRNYLHDEMNKHGFNQDKVDELIMLREKRMLEDIKDAIEKRRDLEVKDMQGATALHVAAANAYVEVLEFLLENDADIEVVDKDGWRPIHAAACWGNEKAIELLVEHGADLESRTPYGETPLDLCEDADTRQFIIDLKNKMKTNKFKVKNNKRKRNNSRSLSVKRSSLKEKISISQNEAKAEAILRQHPELAFLITKDKKTTDEPNQVDLSVEENNFTSKEESPSPVRTQTEEKKIEHANTQITEIPMSKKYERTSKVEEKSTTKIVDIKVIEQGGNEKENRPLKNTSDILKGDKPKGPVTREIDAGPKVQGTTSINIQYKSKTETREHVSQEKKTARLSEKIEPPSCPPPRSPTAGHRQLPADPRGQQTTKENNTIKTGPTNREVTLTKEQRTPATKPLSELSSNPNTTSQSATAAPKSSKTRAAPPVPRSSGSTSGRSQVPSSDTSGYPESFSNRKSRDSQELTETSLQQLTKAKDIKESKVVSPSDVTLSSQAVTAKYTSKPTIPPSSLPSTQPSDRAAVLDVSSETAPTTKRPITNNISNSTVEEPRKKFKQPTDAEQVGRHKKSCCVLM